MTWLAWRQFRGSALTAGIALGAVLIVLLLTGDHIAQYAGTDALTTPYESLQLLGTGLIGVPAIIGAFWGAPLVARELESGTHRLAWTQSITRRRWLVAKLGIAGAAAALATGLFSAAFTRWSLPFDELGNRIGTANFGQRGVVPIAYAAFALCLGTFVGSVARRTLPAMSITLAVYFVVRFTFQSLVRANLVTPVTANLRTSTLDQPLQTGEGWILSSHLVDRAGNAVPGGAFDSLVNDACPDRTDSALSACVERLGIHGVAKYHPADHFWTLQIRESLAFLAMAACLAVATSWWLRHRT